MIQMYAMRILCKQEGCTLDPKERLIELRKRTGLSRKEFAERFEIPYRTIQDWELGNRVMPEYVLRLIAYRVEMDPLLKNDQQDP